MHGPGVRDQCRSRSRSPLAGTGAETRFGAGVPLPGRHGCQWLGLEPIGGTSVDVDRWRRNSWPRPAWLPTAGIGARCRDQHGCWNRWSSRTCCRDRRRCWNRWSSRACCRDRRRCRDSWLDPLRRRAASLLAAVAGTEPWAMPASLLEPAGRDGAVPPGVVAGGGCRDGAGRQGQCCCWSQRSGRCRAVSVVAGTGGGLGILCWPASLLGQQQGWAQCRSWRAAAVARTDGWLGTSPP